MKPSDEGIASAVNDNNPHRARGEPSAKYILTGWLDRLGVNRDELVNAPLLICRLQNNCLRCVGKAECARSLETQLDDAGWDRWYASCTISEVLTNLGAMQNCGRAAQYLKFTRAISGN
jgi:hypothetical protein